MARKKSENETKTEVVYALRHKKCGKLLHMSMSTNRGNIFATDQTVTLEHFCRETDDIWKQDIWYTESAVNAAYVRQYSTPWYNADEETPQHSFNAYELEVVEIHRTIKTTPIKIKVPTFLQYIKLMYAESDPGHYEYLKKEFKSHPHSMADYSLYDLMLLIERGKWSSEGNRHEKTDTKKRSRRKKI
jgi:hypothetical protein